MSKQKDKPAVRFSKTKIVATIGPACEKLEQLKALIRAGVDVFRLNMAHGSREQHAQRLKTVREAVEQTGGQAAVLADLAGPKIRLGELSGGQMTLQADARVRFVRGAAAGNEQQLVTTYGPLVDELAEGDRVMLADGTVSLIVEKRGRDFADCRVVQPGLVRSRQGVNLPGVKLSVPTLGPADVENARWAARNAIDFLGLSFVRSAEDVHDLKAILADEAENMQKNGLDDKKGNDAAHNQTPLSFSSPQVIAKIEKPEAVDHLDAIITAADGVMVARGDLGVETDIARVALVQNQIITACNRQGKPVIVATQMLDSMQHSLLPTRAEVTDVSHAILDGADACMLSGETAIGQFPLEAVGMMHRIALATESILPRTKTSTDAANKMFSEKSVTKAIVDAAGAVADQTDAKLIAVASQSGKTALALAKKRNRAPVVGVSESAAVLRRMCLYWGVFPLAGAPVQHKAELLEYITRLGKEQNILKTGDRIVLLTGSGLNASAHNAIVVHKIGDAK
ncbi:MAG: pyruvate kinase [Thermoguttaceae bacterium]